MAAGQPRAHGLRAAIGVKARRIDSSRPQGDAPNAVLLQLFHHGCGGAQVERGAVMADAHDPPDVGLQKPQLVVVQIGGQVGVIRDHQRQVQRSAVPAAAVVERGNPQQRRIGHVQQIGLEFADLRPHRCPRKREPQFRVEGERVALHAHDAGAFEIGDSPVGREHQDFVAEALELANGFAQGSDDAVDLGNERFSK